MPARLAPRLLAASVRTLFAPVALALLAIPSPTPAAARPQPAPPPPPDPQVIRQGGDTLADAILIPTWPFEATGTTVGYTDDLDEACPYDGSTSPDVVYRFTPQYGGAFDIDLAGSGYDTKVYVYGGTDLELLACNDDYYADYTSRIENVPMWPGTKYYIVVDGYGGAAGQYQLSLTMPPPVVVTCWPGMLDEGEPGLHDGYQDLYNGGCTTADDPGLVQDLPFAGLCARSGWYDLARDHDWYRAEVAMGYSYFGILCDAEHPLRITAYLGAACEMLEEQATWLAEPGAENRFWFGGEDGAEVWLEVRPEAPTPPPGFAGPEFVYWILQEFPVGSPGGQPVAVQTRSWSAVKALFGP